MTDDMQDGIYFDLPENDYHAIPRLSMSGIQSIMVSPATYWAGSHMNPLRPERDDDTNARILGRAYHVARFEPDRLDDLYCRDLDKADMPANALMTDTDIKNALKEMGEPQTKAGENVLERAARLIDAGYEGVVWHYEQMNWEDDVRGDRTAINGEYWDQLVEDMERIHRNPEIAHHMAGGQAEVSVLWTCPETGVEMKCRFDYLKTGSFTDLKTFENSQRKYLDQAITDAVKYNRYYIQAYGYWQVTEILRTGQLAIIGDANDDQKRLIAEIAERPKPLDIWYIFQEKKGVPNLLAYQFMVYAPVEGAAAAESGLSEDAVESARDAMSRQLAIYRKAAYEIDHAKRLYLTYKEVYPDDSAWFPIRPIGKINDESFSPFWLEDVQR